MGTQYEACSRWFLYYLQVSSFFAKGFNTKSTCTKDAYISNTCTKGTFAKNFFFAIGACIKDIYLKSVVIR